VRPQVLVKGGDYRREDVVGHDLVEAAGGETILIDLVPGHSTSALVRRSAPSKPPSEPDEEKRTPAKVTKTALLRGKSKL
jgi:hypothetical protein